MQSRFNSLKDVQKTLEIGDISIKRFGREKMMYEIIDSG